MAKREYFRVQRKITLVRRHVSKPSKRIKTEPGQVISEEEMRKLWKKQQLAKLTVQQLKDWCGVKGIPIGGKKAELVERIEGWFETR